MPECESEIKRQQAVNNQKKELERKQQIIRDALKQVDKKANNKIIFDSDEEPEVKKHKKDKNSKTTLFDSDDEDIKLTGHEFDNKPKITGELIKLQSRFGNDSRFILDERFAENDDKEKNDQNEDKDENEEIDEKAFNFKILENVLGKPVLSKPKENDQDKKSERKYKPMVRYDPEDESHGKYEIKYEKPESKKKKEKKRKEVEEQNEPPVVSKDIFYSVSEDLTQSLKKDENEGFSLLKMFGREVEDDSKIDNTQSKSIDIEQRKRHPLDNKNPFKYDSTDDENEDKSEEYFTKKVEKASVFLNEDDFFFADNDPRLTILKKEEFLTPQKEEEINFSARRRELKRIVKKKIKNIQRDNVKWKANKSWKGHEKRKKQ